jgi:RNA 2',3'-cyclic 3'-phosphodiesterase
MEYPMFDVSEFHGSHPFRPPRPERLFFGIVLDAAAADRVGGFAEQFARENRLEGRFIDRDRLHISLHHAGDHVRLPSMLRYAAKLAGDAVSMPPFDVSAHAVKSFERRHHPGRRPSHPLVLLCRGEGLLVLHRKLGESLERYGLRVAVRFAPHVTLLYGPQLMPFRPIEPIRFTVGGFAFVHSHVGLGKYDILEQWPLGEPPLSPSPRPPSWSG